jgi:DNA-directed RNA polymerase subunit RPC12/RpoP
VSSSLPRSSSVGRPRAAGVAGRAFHTVSCAFFGHRVDNRERARGGSAVLACGCGEPYLGRRGETRVRHTVSCFVKGHTYVPTGARHGHNEYVCTRCGHPLLFARDCDPYARQERFGKKVRYLCNLFGHAVHTVCRRSGFTEYACGCGHTFLRPVDGLARVTHPPVCLFAGHFVRFVEHRDGHAEYRCRNCGHTFGFVEAA